MKLRKLLCIAAIAVLCLTGCGDSEEDKAMKETYAKYETLINALEAGDYQTAMLEISSMYEADPNVQAEKEEKSAAMRSEVIGEWLCSVNSNYTQSVIINDDGTCSIEGRDYTWEVDSASETSLNMTVYQNETEFCNMYMSLSDRTNKYNLSVNDNTNNMYGTFYRASDYTAIEMTTDTFNEYFELVEIATPYYNSFDEYESVSIQHRVFLKEEYADRLVIELSSVSAEYSYTTGYAPLTYNPETGDYTVGEIENPSEPDTTICEFYNMYIEQDDTERYGGSLLSGSMSGTEGELYYLKDSELLRVTGTIYLANE